MAELLSRPTQDSPFGYALDASGHSVCAAHFQAPPILTQVEESTTSISIGLPSISIFWCTR